MTQLELFQPLPPPERLERTIRRKGRNVAATSILSYREEKEQGKFSALEAGILQQLADGRPRTRRQLAKALGKEPSGICQAVKGLVERGEIAVSTVAKCPTTGKAVRWFVRCLGSLKSQRAKTLEP